jgi:hypothetical protein
LIISRGRLVLIACPEGFTGLLIKLCTADYLCLRTSIGSTGSNGGVTAGQDYSSLRATFTNIATNIGNGTSDGSRKIGSEHLSGTGVGVVIPSNCIANSNVPPIAVDDVISLYASAVPDEVFYPSPISTPATTHASSSYHSNVTSHSSSIVGGPRLLRVLLQGVYEGSKSQSRLVTSKVASTLLELYLKDYSDVRDQLQIIINQNIAGMTYSLTN